MVIRRRVGGAVAGLGLLAGLGACSFPRRAGVSPDRPIVPASAVGLIPAPEHCRYTTPVWPPGTDEVVVSRSVIGSYDGGLWRLRLDGSEPVPLPLPDDPECAETGSGRASALPDGRLAYMQTCQRRPIPVPPDRPWPLQAASLMAYDPARGTVERLVPYHFNIRAGPASFAPDQRPGILSDGFIPNESLF